MKHNQPFFISYFSLKKNIEQLQLKKHFFIQKKNIKHYHIEFIKQ